LSGNGISYIYELPSITSDHDITVTFGEMGLLKAMKRFLHYRY